MYDLTVERRFDLIRGPLKCLAYFLDVSVMFVCTTMHWQKYGRLVQELNVCTVVVPSKPEDVHKTSPDK